MAIMIFWKRYWLTSKSEEAQAMCDWVCPLAFDIRLANALIYRMMYNEWGGK